MMEIQFRNKNVHYTSAGKGNPLVLLHGFLEDSRIWDELVNDLQKSRQVICIDLPGHGKTDGFAEIHEMSLMAEVVKAVTDHVGIGGFSIAGHSMGGYVSLEFLRKFPKMLKAVVLINSTPAEDSVEKKAIRDKSVRLVGRNKKAFVSMAISNLYTDESRKLFAAEIDSLKKRAGQLSAKNIQAALKGMKIRTNYVMELQSFDKQKLFIASEDDPILDINGLKLLAEECRADFVPLKRGHNSYMEDRDNLTKTMHFID
ncbi:MAG: alpha/beta hydrolase [Christiangramia sp.]|uniref:Beta-ketoadipate enol-lactone hydrolase n=1 Tax=Christiangramia flava JLT2011 TaxID=1229726 RepID=A0A1L7I2Z5_9FLAO|nr:alpha/beta hydrolase [Christiangramia flava]APU67951.1 Beta-ketoadipate enol-lactone hydrolase [Christiangramia flava JLT2011]MAM19583.1 alpha/beta hydrolase [Christiangramia sp.]OSS40452.1 Beta-ketoadipate enol-lactone hydrolase [Christiangramia flava JLT2011]|tara:strand:- start:424 stop:1197 length:774 start_codon:yes stop_codon:yes gene_type:complete